MAKHHYARGSSMSKLEADILMLEMMLSNSMCDKGFDDFLSESLGNKKIALKILFTSLKNVRPHKEGY